MHLAQNYAAMRATARLFGLAGIVLYNAYLSDWSYRKRVRARPLRDLRCELAGFCLGFEVERSLGIDDRAFLLGLDVRATGRLKIANMPSYVLAAKVCPAGVEATLFALLMGLSNFGSTIGHIMASSC